MAEDIISMVETLDRGSLRGLRDRAMCWSALPRSSSLRNRRS